MNPVIAQKIAAVSAAIEPMKKLAENEAGWNFVSIDQYYDRVATIAREHKLWWKFSELWSSEKKLSRDGEEEDVLTTFYRVTLIDLDYGFEELYGDISIQHPYQGAQTAGSAASYCDKAVMRLLFKVVTGEPDADHFAKGKKKSTPTPAVEVKSPFKKEEPEEQPAELAEAVEPRKRRGRPPTEKPSTEPTEAEETSPELSPALQEEEDDGPPWKEPPQEEYARISEKLLKALAKCKDSAALDQFRLNYDADVKKLKADADTEDEDGGPERRKWAVAAKNVVAAKFRELFDKFSEEAA